MRRQKDGGKDGIGGRGMEGGEGGRKGRMDGRKVEAREKMWKSITFFLFIHSDCMPFSHQVMIILELMANGDLRNYLKSLRPV